MKKIEIKIEEIELYPIFSINSSYGTVKMVSKRFIKKYHKNYKKFKKIQKEFEKLLNSTI